MDVQDDQDKKRLKIFLGINVVFRPLCLVEGSNIFSNILYILCIDVNNQLLA